MPRRKDWTPENINHHSNLSEVDELTCSSFHSSSPAAKRNLKPNPIATAAQQNASFSAPAELSNLQPAVTGAQPQGAFPSYAPAAAQSSSRKRKSVNAAQDQMAPATTSAVAPITPGADAESPAQEPRVKKSRTNTPWTPAEEQRLKHMRDAGNSWSEIAKVGRNPARTSPDARHPSLYTPQELQETDRNVTDVHAANGGERKEALVQGRHGSGYCLYFRPLTTTGTGHALCRVR